MPTDWKNITEDELLNNDTGSDGHIARYDRIIRKKTNDSLMQVWAGLHDVKVATIQSSEKIVSALNKAEESSSKFQKATIALTIVIAVATVIYTCITWQAVQVGKEANKIQLQLLQLQLQNSSNQALKAQPLAAGSPQSGAP